MINDFIVLIQNMHYLSDLIFNLFEEFPAFVFANKIGSLVNNLFGVKHFNPFPVYPFSRFNLPLLERISSGSSFTPSSLSSACIGGKLSPTKSKITF